MEDKLITLFVPGNALESYNNTYAGAKIEDKLRLAMRRYLQNKSFTQGNILGSTPRIFIDKHYFDPNKIGYDVIAHLL